ncbi:agglutinin biogenesis protein MshP [Ideonella azotifigens]|nr:agglutinin biogenesis protein MshP [Ideonella azotifigens]MCD2343106.1 agglutinin biogenesis protein MshP [Ideonella azotifigens]
MPSTSTTCPEREAAQRGFTMVTMIFVLVILAALGTALAALSQRQALGSAMDLNSARAMQAARAGLEWGAWQVMRNPAAPAAAPACPATTSFVPGGTLSGFTVTIVCSRTPTSGTVSDGATNLAFYQLTATACNLPSGGACPATGTPNAVYVERQLSWMLARP